MQNLNLEKERLTPELQLILLLCSSYIESCDRETLKSLISSIDWDAFLKLSNRFKLNYFIYSNIKNNPELFPELVIEHLRNNVFNNSKKMLLFSVELNQLAKSFYDERIRFACFKGILLAQELYGNSGTRQCRDIDLLVSEVDVPKVDTLLKNHGYIRKSPAMDLQAKQLNLYIKNYHHFIYQHSDKPILVELHWKLNRQDTLYPQHFQQLESSFRKVESDKLEIETLSNEDYLLYLSVHGCLHNWFRLFWLKDISEIIKHWNFIDLDMLLLRAKQHDMHRPLVASIVLAGRFFDSPVQKSYADLYNSDGGIKKIVENSSAEILKPGDFNLSKRNLEQLSTLFNMSSSFNHKLRSLLSLFTSYHDWELLPLPEKLFFLYYLLRPFLWTYRRLRSRKKK